MHRFARNSVLLLGVCWLASTRPASAEEEGESNADRSFQHAVELMKADQCEEAIPEFLRSQALDPSSATLLNLGTCYARLGRKATAWRTYRRAAEAALEEKNEPLHERAVQAMNILGPTLTKLQIVAPKGSLPLSIRVNGEVIADHGGVPIPLDPGESVIEAAAPGHEPWRQSVTANELGATVVVHVPDLRPLPPPAQPRPLTLILPPAERPDLRLPGAIIGGVGVVAVAVGSVFGLSAKSTYDDSEPFCRGNRCTAPGIALRDSARDKAAVSTVTISLGLVAAAAGAVLWVTSPSTRKPERATLVGTWLEIDGSYAMAIQASR